MPFEKLASSSFWHLTEERHTVMTSKRLMGDENLGGHLVTCAGRGIFLPVVRELHPSRGKLEWHRRELFAG